MITIERFINGFLFIILINMEEYWKVDGTRERYSLFRDDAEIGRIDLRFSEESETMPRTRALRIDQNISLEYLIKAINEADGLEKSNRNYLKKTVGNAEDYRFVGTPTQIPGLSVLNFDWYVKK
ncbi:hypothetical protein CL617_01910 [archaeon]|nr:hypothetical protein [archaeon]|tara:strand:+ start:4351 stop:4722 length:372 start_codon:yes stop_codon:yes gene_type:complete